MKLYLTPGCPFAHRVTISLREKGLPFEPVLFDRTQRPPELCAVGPFAKSPTLFDGGTVVYDGQVVLEYLEDAHPSPALMPAQPAGRARVRFLITRFNDELGPHLGALAMELVYKTAPDPEKVAHAKRALLEALAAWDQRLIDAEFLVDDMLSLSDLVLYTPLVAMRDLAGLQLPAELVHLQAWMARMDARASTPRVMSA
jgi:glutathione S-transferase